jgi:hypothetical protein
MHHPEMKLGLLEEIQTEYWMVQSDWIAVEWRFGQRERLSEWIS